MEYRKIIKRGKMTYYLSENAVVVGISKYQFISYNIYNSPSRSNLVDFRKRIANSKEDQYNSVTEQINLAQKCNLIGTGTQKPKWIEE
jgi:hypothetical protein